MSDSVLGAENDNTNPDGDNLASVTTESHTIICESELDDDFFVCRKCNKVFKNLPEYLEHKIKDENYKLSHTRSKLNKRLVIPHLVEKKKNPPKKSGVTGLRTVDNPNQSSEIAQGPNVTNADGNEADVLPGSIKRGRKRKAEIQEPLPSLSKDNSCHLCDQKFRRAATLRWHIKNDHKKKDDDSEDSDGDDDGSDRDFVPKSEQGDDHGDNNSHNNQYKVMLSSMGTKKTGGAIDVEETEEGENKRPYICEICGRGFKELPVYKAHAIVHSSERNFVCTVDGCPYGFKTKGCLVRHMRRHTGERPFNCEKCGRAFAESGALNRHLKARRNCAQTPDTHYPRYRKKWNYHPNIEAVVDQSKRDVHIGYHQEHIDTNYFIKGGSLPLNDVIGDKLIIEGGNAHYVGTQITVTDVKSEMSPRTVMSISGSSETPAEMSESNEKTGEMREIQSNSTVEFLKDTQCLVCQKDFQNIDHLEVHLRTHLADQPSHCGLCHFLAQNREEMRQHILTLHNESLDDIESTVFAMDHSEQNLSAAQQKDEKSALREALLAIKQLHRIKVSNDKADGLSVHPSTAGSLQCMICHRTFKGINYMRQHMRMHTGDRPFKCPQCNSSFTSKDVMKKHMYVHMNQREYKCGECGKMFKRLVHVQQHIKTHSQERSYRCNLCEKLFKTHNSLKVHLRTHTNVNPYRCKVCGRHFRERGSLRRHSRLHTGEKPYVCPHCNRGFAEQGTLSRHLKAKVPCSATRESNVQQPGPSNNTVLAQFSSMVADTQYILPPGNSEELADGNLIVLKTDDGESEEVIENIEVITEENVLAENLIPSESIDQIVGGDDTETLQVFDPTTGESLIITGDKSVMERLKGQQLAIESMDGGLSLDKIRDILMAAGETQPETSADSIVGVGAEEGSIIISEEMVLTDDADRLEINESDGDVQQVAHLGSEVITTVLPSDGVADQVVTEIS